MKVRETGIDEFNRALASKSPVPGGGAAAGVIGAVGASLGLMVSNLTSGKKKYAEFEDRLCEIITVLENAERRFTELADEDEENFMPLSRAYKLPSDTEEEKRVKDEVMEAALRRACIAPSEAMELSVSLMDVMDELAERGSRLSVSDAGAGVKSLEAALSISVLNICINTKMMKDRKYAGSLEQNALDLLARGMEKSRSVYNKVLGELMS